MLQAIRQRTWLLFGIVIILVLPFALFGVGRFAGGGGEQYVAKVNDSEISERTYRQEFQQYKQRLRQQFGEALSDEYFERASFKRQFLEQLIDERLLRQVAADTGFAVPDSRVASEISKVQAFRSNGTFDRQRYRQLLSRQGLTPESFEQRLRQDLTVQEVRSSVRSSAAVTAAEVREFIRLRDQQRRFDAVLVRAEEFEDQVSVSDEEVEQHYNDHSDRYMRPERVRIRYVELSADMLADEVEVTEETLRSRYEENKSRYTLEEERQASHILIEVPEDAAEERVSQARQRAAELAERARSGEAEFTQLAQEHSQDTGTAADGGDLGWISRDVMGEAFEKALFDLEPGQVSDPVRTDFGFHVIKLRDVRPGEVEPFEAVREEIAEGYRQSEAERLYLEQADRLVNLSYENPMTLEPAAAQLGLEIQEAGPFSREGGEQGVATNSDVVEKAFSPQVLEERMNSDLVELGPNHAAVIRVNEHIPAEAKPLEEVADEIRSTLVDERTRELARKEADELVERLRGGETTLTEIASERGAEVQNLGFVGRDASEPDAQVVQGVFELPKPDGEGPAFARVSSQGNRFAVVALHETKPGNPQDVEAERLTRIRQRLASAYARGELTSFIDALREDAEIEIKQERL